MADLLTAEKLRLFLIFMVPGIVILYVRRQFVVNRRLALSEALPNYIAISIFYQAVAWPLTLLLVGDGKQLVVHSAVWIGDLFSAAGAGRLRPRLERTPRLVQAMVS